MSTQSLGSPRTACAGLDSVTQRTGHSLVDLERELLIGQFELEQLVFELFHVEQHDVEGVIRRVIGHQIEVEHDAFTERRVIERTGRNKHVLIGVADKRA